MMRWRMIPKVWKLLHNAFDQAARARADLIDAAAKNVEIGDRATKRIQAITHRVSPDQGIVDAVRKLERDLAKDDHQE